MVFLGPTMDWIRIMSVAEAEIKLEINKPRLAIIGQRQVALVRLSDKIYAFDNACPHNQEPLHRGGVNSLGEIICPWHNYRFNIRTGLAMDSTCNSLQLINVKEEMGQLYLAL